METKAIWVKDRIINIQVRNFNYDAEILFFGNEHSPVGDGSAWGWVKHLRDKNWWSQETEQVFLRLAETIKF